jgi:hypothetical protein
LIGQSCENIEEMGFHEKRFQISTFNVSEDNQQAVAILSWPKAYEDALTDVTRDGCSCIIF